MTHRVPPRDDGGATVQGRLMRCFIAVAVPAGVRDALVAAQAALRAWLRHADDEGMQANP